MQKKKKLKSYYNELKKCLDSGNESKIIKAANRIIGEFDREVEAWKCKVVALIQLGNFLDALKFISKCRVAEHFVFEKAYSQYRLNDVLGAWNTIQESEDSSPRVKELEAQILYRLERYDDCYIKYRELVKSISDDFDVERLTNLAAVSANIATEGGNAVGPLVGGDSTYEQVYNHACELLARGQLEQAFSQLTKSEKLCGQYLTEEGASPEEILDESAIIRVQEAQCLQRLGREKEALAIYNSVLKEKHDDISLSAVINNNLIAINREGNLFDSKKRVKSLTVPEVEHKLTSIQKATMALNQALLSYHTHQDTQCESECRLLVQTFPQKSKEVRLLRASLLGRLGRLDEVESVLQEEFSGESADYASLVATQLYLSQKSTKRACDHLEKLQKKKGFPNGIISALVSIYLAEGKMQEASRTFKEAVEWHKGNKTSANQLSELWHHAADFHLRNGDPLSAAAALKELKHLNPTDKHVLALLIISYAQFDMNTARDMSRELPPVTSLVTNLDIEQLEMSMGPKHYKKTLYSKTAGDAATPPAKSPGSDLAPEKKKKKKKKKIRLPKRYYPGQEPDPDRWLPRWQRKFMGKKKQRAVRQMKGTQGFSSDAADAFDITKTAGQYSKIETVTSPKANLGAIRRNQQRKKTTKPKKKAW